MHNGIWRTVLIVSQDHDPVVVADTNLTWMLTHTSWVEDIRYFFQCEHPYFSAISSGKAFYPLLFDTLKEMGLNGKTIGFETGPEIATYLCIDEFQMIREKLPDAKIVAADPVIWDQRMIKTAYEQNIIREGCRRACICVRSAFDAIRPGVTEKSIHQVFWQKAVEQDLVESPVHATWLCYTSNPAETLGGHRWITGPVDRTIKAGDFGHCDCGPTYKRYEMDFQRAFTVGEPSKETRKFYEIGRDAYLETIEAMKPGKRIGDFFDISVKALEKRGFPHGHAISFIGHGEGLSNHEPPWFTADEDLILQPGMVVAIEIGAFDPEGVHFGGMPEDILLVTETGTENLTAHLSLDLYVAG
jgi:Xaa-Pro aminopeptidase/Xaa-Pro dipeptidase